MHFQPVLLLCFSVLHSASEARAFTKHSTRSADSAAVKESDTGSQVSEEMSAKTTKLLEKRGKTDGSFSGALLPRDVPAGFYRRNLRKRNDLQNSNDQESQKHQGDEVLRPEVEAKSARTLRSVIAAIFQGFFKTNECENECEKECGICLEKFLSNGIFSKITYGS
jgi:hypothetical protein